MQCHAFIRDIANNFTFWSYSSIVFKHPVALVAVHSKAIILLLFLHKVSIMCCPGFAKQYFDGEERAGCFTLIVLLVDCDCYCSVAHLTVLWVGLQCMIILTFCFTSV